MKLEAEDCPFVFAFFESCECLREAMKAEKEWLVVANEYTYFLESEVKDLTSRRNNLQSKVCLGILKTHHCPTNHSYHLCMLAVTMSLFVNRGKNTACRNCTVDIEFSNFAVFTL